VDSGGLIGELQKVLAERMPSAAMNVHSGNQTEASLADHPNGHRAETVLTPEGSIELSIPRDCQGRFDRALNGNYRRRSPIRSIGYLLQRPQGLIYR
jgi:putative transposase